MIRKIYKTGKFKLWSYTKDQIRKNHKLTYLFWECTMNCNFFCKHCGSSAGRKFFKDELATEEIKKAFKNVADHNDPKKIMIAVTGGEPLVRNDLFEVMEYASSLGFPWGMVTNGFLVTKEVVQKMKKTGMRTVVVSIDGIGSIHDQFRGMKNAYQHAIQAVKLLAERNFLNDLQITTTVHKGNFHLLESMYQTFVKLPITSWRVFNVDPIGRAEYNKDLLLEGVQLKKLLQFIKEKRKKSKINITYGCAGFLGLEFEDEVRDHLFICNTGINTGSILYNGDIFICPNVPRRKELVQGNIKTDSFSKVWEERFELFRDRNRTKSKKCESCSFWEDCLGGSFHLWDFEKHEPKFCHYQLVQ